MPNKKLLSLLVSLLLTALACNRPGLSGAQGEPVDEPVEAQITENGYVQLDEVFPLDPGQLPDWSEYIPADLPPPLDANPINLQVLVDEAFTVSREIGPQGGTLALEAPSGVSYTLEIQPHALLSRETITMTLVSTINGISTDGDALAAVNLQPEGLALLLPANLIVELPGAANLDDYVGFISSGTGEEAHRLMDVDIGGKVQLTLTHFSTTGFANSAKAEAYDGLLEALERAEPSEVSAQAQQHLADAAQEYGETSGEFVREVTITKSNWFWQKPGGVVHTLDDAVSHPENLEIAIHRYLEWRNIFSIQLSDFYLALGIHYPFPREEKIAEMLITLALQNALTENCTDAIDGLRKIRYLRIAQTLDAEFDIPVFSLLDITEAAAMQTVQNCARFKFTFTSTVTGQLEGGDFEQVARAEDIIAQFGEEPEAVTLSVQQTRPSLEADLGCTWVIKDGLMSADDMRWPINIFYNYKETFAQSPPTIDFVVNKMPQLTCSEVPEAGFSTGWWSVFTAVHGFGGERFEVDLRSSVNELDVKEVNISFDDGDFFGTEQTTIYFEHDPVR